MIGIEFFGWSESKLHEEFVRVQTEIAARKESMKGGAGDVSFEMRLVTTAHQRLVDLYRQLSTLNPSVYPPENLPTSITRLRVYGSQPPNTAIDYPTTS